MNYFRPQKSLFKLIRLLDSILRDHPIILPSLFDISLIYGIFLIVSGVSHKTLQLSRETRSREYANSISRILLNHTSVG